MVSVRSKIPFSEITKRKFSKPFRKRNTGIFDLPVYQSVGRFVLLKMREKRQNDECGNKSEDNPYVRKCAAFCQRVHITLHHIIQDPHACHCDQIDNHCPGCACFRVFQPLIGQCIFLLKLFT